MSWSGSLRGLSVGLWGGMIESRDSRRVVPLALPSLRSTAHPLYQLMLVEVSIMLSPCHPEIGTKATDAGLYPTFLMNPPTSFWISSNLAWEYGGSVESILLTATISCLTPRVEASRACSLVCPFFEIPASNSPVPEAMISTPQSAWHVPDEVTMSRSVNDCDVVLGGLKLPESDIDGDSTLTFGFQFVHNPCVLERALAGLLGFLLELLNGSLVNSSTLVDQMSSGGRLARVDVTDDDNVDMNLLLTHLEVSFETGNDLTLLL